MADNDYQVLPSKEGYGDHNVFLTAGQERRYPSLTRTTSRARIAAGIGATILVGLFISSLAPPDSSISWPSIARTWSSSCPNEALISSNELSRSRRDDKVRMLYGFDEYEGRDWLDQLRALDDDGLAPLTKFAQETIFRHQNRPAAECATAKYFQIGANVDALPHHGIGSTAHVLGWNLGAAIEAGYILTYDKVALGAIYVDEECQDINGERSLGCIFEPVTNCTKEYMNEQNTVSVGDRAYLSAPPMLPEWAPQNIPTIFSKALDADLPMLMEPDAKKYWWRKQSAAYVLRLSAASMAELRNLRMKKEEQNAWTLSRWNHESTQLTLPFPLPKGTISMHVRHGDKASEMQLLSLDHYVKAAESLANTNPMLYYKIGFVSTEDQAVIDETRNITALDGNTTTPNLDWIWFSSNIPRMNGSGADQLATFGRSMMTIRWMLQLFMAIECDAFIGTRNSNWNALIDGMRCVWMDKCARPFVEVGQASEWQWYWW